MFAELPGVSYYAIYIATALSAAIGSILIGLLANLPLAQAPAMGSNAFFVYTVCLGFAFGIISYVLIQLFAGKGKEINGGTWVIAGLFTVMFLVTH